VTAVLDREPVKQKNPPRQKEIHMWCMTSGCPFTRCGIKPTGSIFTNEITCTMCAMLKDENVFYCAVCKPPRP
jgi:hypothetical protein